jgi:hypothetical protein
MADRVDPFANLSNLPAFEPKAPKEKPVAKVAIDRIADENDFPSRQAVRPSRETKRKPRLYRTGRNRQFNVKLKSETVERFYKMADERKVPLGALMEQALEALERAGEQ